MENNSTNQPAQKTNVRPKMNCSCNGQTSMEWIDNKKVECCLHCHVSVASNEDQSAREMDSQKQALQDAKEVKDTLNWALENCSAPTELQSDLFNILINAVTSAERLIEYASIQSKAVFSSEDMMQFGLGVRNNDDQDSVSDLLKDYIKHTGKFPASTVPAQTKTWEAGFVKPLTYSEAKDKVARDEFNCKDFKDACNKMPWEDLYKLIDLAAKLSITTNPSGKGE